jgi:hypothetical protein
MKRTQRVITLLLVGVIVAIQMACAPAPQNTNQPSANANTAPTNSSQAKNAQPDNTSTGIIEVTSVPPGARVLLIATDDDTANEPQSKGSTPATITGVRPGKYTVDLEKQGYRFYQKEVTVKKGTTVKVVASLKKR